MNSETFIYCCERCGQIFESSGYIAKYCPACRPAVKNEQSKMSWLKNRGRYAPERPRRVKTSPGVSVGEICKRAAALHMTYGQYVAKYGGNTE